MAYRGAHQVKEQRSRAAEKFEIAPLDDIVCRDQRAGEFVASLTGEEEWVKALIVKFIRRHPAGLVICGNNGSDIDPDRPATVEEDIPGMSVLQGQAITGKRDREFYDR